MSELPDSVVRAAAPAGFPARAAQAGVVRFGATGAALMMGWLTVVLWLDRADGGGSHPQQRLLGLLTWVVLGAALLRVHPIVRMQTLVVVAFATGVEFLSSPTLHVYTYRFHNVPMYVPPGHGLVYLSAFVLGHSRFVQQHLRACTAAAICVGGLWAAYGLVLSSRHDVLGAFWFVCLVLFVRWGPSQAVYVGAFVVVGWLELAGTHLGTWVWSSHDPTGRILIGNPPSGAAGGYGWFDLAALLAAPPLLVLVTRRRTGPPPEAVPTRPAVPADEH